MEKFLEEVVIENPIKVFIKINENYEIVKINSNIFINDYTDWIQIDEGYGDKYAHAQNQYFKKPIQNISGEYNYKFINGKIIDTNLPN